MRKWLFAFLMSVFVAVPARAQDLPMGPLQLVAQFPIDQPYAMAPAVLAPAYSNITNFLGLGVANGGAAPIDGVLNTIYVADDIEIDPSAIGQPISHIYFTVGNFSPAPVSARVKIRFHRMDGPGGLPGSYINGFTSLSPTAFAPGVSLFHTVQVPFSVPSKFWAGATFDNLGTSTTEAQLNLLGQGVFDPPTSGGSQDVIFLTNAASIGNVGLPQGFLSDLGGEPNANFGWAFIYDEPVPVNASTWGRVKAQYRN